MFFRIVSNKFRRAFSGLSRRRKSLLFFNILLAVYSLIAFLAVYVPPARFWLAGFLTLSIPIVLILHLLFLFYWLWVSPKRTVFSVFVLILAFPLLKRTFTLHINQKPPAKGSFTVLTYNAQNFNTYEYFNKNEENRPQENISWLTENEADIKCLQEFFNRDDSKVFHSMPRLLKNGKYQYYTTDDYQEIHSWKGFHGVAIFSKFPIVGHGDLFFDKNTLNKGIYADIKIAKDTIRVFSVHLSSMSIKEEKLEIDKDYEVVKSDFLDIFRRLKKGFIKHSREITTLERYIRKSPHPVIVCGDFNEMPYGFAYQRIRSHLKNAFEDAGNGFGFTYNKKKLFFLRIDNQFYSGSDLQIHNYHTYKDVTFSDHHPVIATYSLPTVEE